MANKKEQILAECEQYGIQKTSPIKAIKEKCIDCCCGQRKEVEICGVPECALYPFRFGKNPFTNKTVNLTEEQKIERANRLREMRSKNNNE